MNVFRVIEDTRESVGYRFPETVSIAWPDGSRTTRRVAVVREMLPPGDYSTPALRGLACVERKVPGDFAQSITHERSRFDRELARMRLMRWKAIVVEGCVHEVIEGDEAKGTHGSLIHPNAITGTVASFQARYGVPVLFCASAGDAARLTLGLLRRWEEELRKERSRQRLAIYRKARAA